MLRQAKSQVSHGKPCPTPAKLNRTQARLVRTETQASPIEVVQMLGKKQRPAGSEDACRPAIQVRHIQKKVPVRSQQSSTVLKEALWVRNVFEYIPQRDGVKAALVEVCHFQRRTLDWLALAKVVARLRAEGLVRLDTVNAPTGLRSLGQKKTGCATDVKQTAPANVSLQNFQMNPCRTLSAPYFRLVN